MKPTSVLDRRLNSGSGPFVKRTSAVAGLPGDGPRLTELMLQHGYDEASVRKILGENYLRTCSEVWK